MTNHQAKTVLCITSYEKGQEFMRECMRQGWHVILLTVTALEHADWPRECLDEVYYMPDLSKKDDVTHGVSYLARSRVIDHIVALDDYDVWTAASLREHLRLPGMGESAVRYFRDKLAMRLKAQQHGIPVPDFVHVLNYDKLREFMERVPAPWLLKPRAEASTIGIAKIAVSDELWSQINTLGDLQSFYLLERFVPSEVYHVDALVINGQIIFAEVHQYGRPPLEVFHEGGVSTTRTLPRGSVEEQTLQNLSHQVIGAFGMERGIAHIEFIRRRSDGRFYFLETAARVGGANTVEMVEASTGINLWREWARIETATDDSAYRLPTPRQDYAGVIISLARQEYPDTSAYQDPEITWRLNKRHHVGFVVTSPDHARVQSLLEAYSQRFADDFAAVMPPLEGRPPSVQP